MLYSLAVLVVVVTAVLGGKSEDIASRHLKKASAAFGAVGKVEKFSSLRRSGNLEGYAVYQSFSSDDTAGCVGSPQFLAGVKLNYCVPDNVDPATKIAHSSTMYTATSTDKLVMSSYASSGNCTGEVQANAVITANCYGSTSWVIKTTNEPWQSMGPGTVTEIYDSTQACAGADSGYTFLYFGESYCIVDQGDSYNSYTLSGCKGKTVDTNYFSDEQCQSLVRSMPSGLGSCMETTSNSLPAWVSRKCSA